MIFPVNDIGNHMQCQYFHKHKWRTSSWLECQLCFWGNLSCCVTI